jgi:hypothetical protein
MERLGRYAQHPEGKKPLAEDAYPPQAVYTLDGHYEQPLLISEPSCYPQEFAQRRRIAVNLRLSAGQGAGNRLLGDRGEFNSSFCSDDSIILRLASLEGFATWRCDH